MDIFEAMRARHSVRDYLEQPIDAETVALLQSEIDDCNAEGGLHIQLVTEEPVAFGGFMAHYGKFSGVRNYIALVGKKGPHLSEAVGYYGERIVLKAQSLGLNTCWVAMTYSKRKSKCVVGEGEKLVLVIALGYGKTQGVPHKSKPMEALCRVEGETPDWFIKGMEAAMLAPTAVNQQRFLFSLNGDTVTARALSGTCSRIDLGIVEYHFEVGSGRRVMVSFPR